MSKAINTKQLERLVHQSFHDLADKYGMDVDLIAEIISDYSVLMDNRLEARIIVSEN